MIDGPDSTVDRIGRSGGLRKAAQAGVATAAIFSVVASAPIVISGLAASDMPLAEKARSFLALMDGRSPGSRTAAELLKTKDHKRSLLPGQRALTKVRPPQPPDELLTAILPPSPRWFELESPIVATQIATLPPSPTMPTLPPVLLPPGSPGVLPPGVGPSPPPVGPFPPPGPPSPPVAPAIPEPTTWALMLVGFGFIGWTMRSQNRRALESS